MGRTDICKAVQRCDLRCMSNARPCCHKWASIAMLQRVHASQGLSAVGPGRITGKNPSGSRLARMSSLSCPVGRHQPRFGGRQVDQVMDGVRSRGLRAAHGAERASQTVCAGVDFGRKAAAASTKPSTWVAHLMPAPPNDSWRIVAVQKRKERPMKLWQQGWRIQAVCGLHPRFTVTPETCNHTGGTTA